MLNKNFVTCDINFHWLAFKFHEYSIFLETSEILIYSQYIRGENDNSSN
jgi:hypothetical protein